MRRREFIAGLGGAAAWPLVARGQQTALPVVGVLSSGSPEPFEPLFSALLRGLNERGYIDGKNVTLEARWARGNYDDLPKLASNLVLSHAAVIVTVGGTASARAAKAATTKVPIVFTIGGDPVEDDLVNRLNQPGGNLTGVTFFSNALLPKRLALLRELIPKAAVFAVLLNPNNVRAQIDTIDVEKAARTIGQQIQMLNAGTAGDIDRAFAAMVREHADALLVSSDAFFFARRDQLVKLAARYAVPANYPQRQFVEAGGLFSYGSDTVDAHRQAGVYAGRILKGERPGDLPVQQPTKFDLVINLKTAKTLGLDVPPALLASADEVIE
jgi:putative tryptophan/tyrosine transport system substrate-binding protein